MGDCCVLSAHGKFKPWGTFKKKKNSYCTLAGVAQLVGASPHTLKGHMFNSQSGHIGEGTD